MGFRKINAESMKTVLDPEWKPTKSYKIYKDECFDYLTDAAKITAPAREWAERKLGLKTT